MNSLHEPSIINYQKLLQEKSGFLGNNDKKIVLVGGCFDIIHLGHIVFLEKAKKLGELLVAALESDEFIKNEKKREPFHNQLQRAKVLAAIKSVDFVITMPFLEKENRDDGYKKLVQAIKPSFIAVSENDRMMNKKVSHAKLVGAEVKTVTSILYSLSSSQIIKYGALLSD